MRVVQIFAVLVFFASVVTHARGDFMYVSQSREVRASGAGGTQSFSAPDFGFFDRSAVSSNVMFGGGGFASQRSLLGLIRIDVAGGANSMDGTNGISGSARSFFNVEFDIPNVNGVRYTLQGTWSASRTDERTSVIAFVRLSRFDVTILSTRYDEPAFDSDDFRLEGRLSQGRYRLEVHFETDSLNFAGTTRGSGTYSVSMTIPAVGMLPMMSVLMGLACCRRRR